MLFAACGKTTDKPNNNDRKSVENLGGNFVATALLEYGDTTVEAEIVKEQANRYTMTITAPDSLKGMKVKLQDDDIFVQYGILKYQVKNEDFPNTAAIKLLVNAVFSAVSEDAVLEAESDTLVVSGNVGVGEYFLTIDRKTGHMLKLEVPSENFLLVFRTFAYSK